MIRILPLKSSSVSRRANRPNHVFIGSLLIALLFNISAQANNNRSSGSLGQMSSSLKSSYDLLSSLGSSNSSLDKKSIDHPNQSNWQLSSLPRQNDEDLEVARFLERRSAAVMFASKKGTRLAPEIDRCSIQQDVKNYHFPSFQVQHDFTRLCPDFARRNRQATNRLFSKIIPAIIKAGNAFSEIKSKTKMNRVGPTQKIQGEDRVLLESEERNCETLMDSPELISWYLGDFPPKWKEPIDLIIQGSKNDPQLLIYMKELLNNSPEQFHIFLDRMSESHIQAQTRFFNKANSIPAKYLAPVVKALGNINCEPTSGVNPSFNTKNECVSLQVSDAIDLLSATVMKTHLGLTFRAVEEDKGVKVFSRQTNPMSLKFLGRGFPSKPKSIKAKTASTGLIAGLIPFEQNLSKADADSAKYYNADLQKQLHAGTVIKIPFKRDGFFAILDEKAENGQRWESEAHVLDKSGLVKASYRDQVIEVVGDPASQLPITGDNDTALIAYKPRPDQDLNTLNKERKIAPDLDNGIESRLEAKVREEVNSTLKDAERPGAITRTRALRDIIHHGPDARNPTRTPIDYPWVNSHGQELKNKKELSAEINKLIAEGYEFFIPTHWKRELDLDYRGNHRSHGSSLQLEGI